MSLARQIVSTDAPKPLPGLARYEAACRALAEAKSVDEAKDIRDQADAMRVYAHQAGNKTLEIDAAEIRMRAERRLGELITAQKATIGLNSGTAGVGRPPKGGAATEPPKDTRPTLAEVGIDKKLSSRAQKMAAVPEAEFEEMIGDWRQRVQDEQERITTNLLRAGEKKLARDEKEAVLAEKMRAASEALGQGRYGVIYADPPWRFEPYSRESGMDRSADNHYPTMILDDIAALDVPAADDCVLFLWATVPMLPEALSVMSAWGFAYKSHLVWAKDRIGTGYWARNKHELLLIGTKGDIPAPEMGTQPESLILAPVGAHSSKPDVFAETIERLFPNLPKIELFARAQRQGWNVWGAESETTPDPQNPGMTGGHPSTPSSADEGAKTDGVPVGGQAGEEPGAYDLHAGHEDAGAAQDRNEPVSAGEATAEPVHSFKPNVKAGCLHPATCKLTFTAALCWKCNDARAKSRAAA